MSNQTIKIQYDDDGFLVGKKRLDSVQSKVDATYDATKKILNTVKNPSARRVVLSGRVGIQNATNSAQKHTYNRTKVTSNSQRHESATKAVTRTLIQQTPAQKQIEQQERRKERRYKSAVSKSNQIQEKLLRDINRNLMKNGSSSLLSKFLPLLAAGGLAKGLFKLPLALGAAGAAALAKSAMKKAPVPIVPVNNRPTTTPAVGKRSILARSMAAMGKGGAYVANKGGSLLGKSGSWLAQGGAYLSAKGGSLLGKGGTLLTQGGAALAARGGYLGHAGRFLTQGGSLFNRGGTLLAQGGTALSARGGALLSRGGAALGRGGVALGARSTAFGAPRPITTPVANSSMANMGKGFGGSLARGGILAAALAAFQGIGIEKSDMDRADKNKSHFKNFFSAGGGIAGATGGAAIGASVGSVVPVVGTAIGGVVGAILGGIGGSTLAEYFIESIDDAIDPKLSRKMFSSWDGFIDVLEYGANSVWQMLVPEKVKTFFNDLGIDSSTYHTTITGLASTFWTATTDSAKALWENYVPKEVQDFFSKLIKFGEKSFDGFKEGYERLFEAIANTPVGEALGDSWKWVKNKAGQAWDSAKEYVGIGDNQNVKGNARQQANDYARRNGYSEMAEEGAKAIDRTVNQAYQASKQTSKAADYAMAKALPASAQRCAEYVNNSLRAQGLKIWGHGHAVAGNLLASNQGFHEVKYDKNYVPQDGDVMSMPSHSKSKHKYGHVGIYSEKKKRWVSDFVQPVYGNNSTAAASKDYWNEIQSGKIVPTIARKGSYVNAPTTQKTSQKPAQTPVQQNTQKTGFDHIPIVNVLEVGKGYNVVELADGSIIKQTGDWNWRNRNQGNIEDGSFAKSVNGLDQSSAKGATGSKRFAAFSTFAEGRAAKQKLIFTGKNYKNITLTKSIERFAPPWENDTEKYQRVVLSAVGGVNKRMSEYTPAEQAKIMDTIERHEGMKVGKVEVLRKGRGAMPTVKNAAVKMPSITPSKSQEMAVNANNVAIKAAKIEPQKVSTPSAQAKQTGNGQLANGTTSTNGQIAHAPVRRQVSNPEIASITSGGIGA